MNRLIKADFDKLKHDKALLVGLILVAVFSFLTTIVYLVVKQLLVTDGLPDSINYVFSAHSSLSVGSNVGLIAAIVAIIILAREYNYGTIRNRVVAGFSRFQIYLGQSFVSVFVALGLYLVNIIFAMLFGAIFLGTKGVTSDIVRNLFIGIGLSSLVFIFCTLIANFYANIFKSAGVPIVLYIVTILVLSGLSQIYALYNFPEWVEWLCAFNPMYQAVLAGDVVYDISKLTIGKLLITLFSEVGYIALITFIGGLIFKKNDLK